MARQTPKQRSNKFAVRKLGSDGFAYWETAADADPTVEIATSGSTARFTASGADARYHVRTETSPKKVVHLRRPRSKERQLTVFDGEICVKAPIDVRGMIQLSVIEAKAERRALRRDSALGDFIDFRLKRLVTGRNVARDSAMIIAGMLTAISIWSR